MLSVISLSLADLTNDASLLITPTYEVNKSANYDEIVDKLLRVDGNSLIIPSDNEGN